MHVSTYCSLLVVDYLYFATTIVVCCFVCCCSPTRDHHIQSLSSKVETNETTTTIMMEHTALNGTTSTTTIIKDQEERKKKKRFGPLILFTALLLGLAVYARQIRGRSSLASSDTTRGAITASLMMSNDNLGRHCYRYNEGCHQSVGIYDSQKDYCYTCGYSYDDSVGYCWNSQNWQCPPACNNVQEVYSQGDNQCGDPCKEFLSCKDVKTKKLCEAMGYTWDSEYGQGCV